jgi:hypothetical protein
MKRRAKFLIGFLGMAILLSGCATWQLIKKENTKWKNGAFSAELPEGWVKSNPMTLLYLTKDGGSLQGISFYFVDTKKEQFFTKKKIEDSMLPQDIAAIIVDEMTLNRGSLLNFKVLENKPLDIDGVKGFRIDYSYNTSAFTKYKAVRCGFFFEKKFYEIVYMAAAQHYYEDGIADFESFLKSFRIKKKADRR